MTYSRSLRHHWHRCAKATTIFGIAILLASTCRAQATRPSQPAPDAAWLQDLNKNPELQADLKKLLVRLQHELPSPPARSQSHLLPLLPASTTIYAAFPNYGDLVHQTLTIFRQELQQDAALRNWWQHGDMATTGPKVELTLDKLDQLFQYLGDEIVLTGSMDLPHPKLLVISQVRKPGLDTFLRQMLPVLAGKTTSGVRVLGPKDLPSAEDGPAQQLLVLVRPDFVIATSDVATLRSLNASIDRGVREFALTPFGARVQQAYEGGASAVVAADLHSIVSRIPSGAKQNQLTFQRTGFADAKYLVWRHVFVADRAISEGELSFNGPRHGAASWLAAPAPMGSLDFASPNAVMVAALRLASLAKIFDDIADIASASGSHPFAALPQFEQMLNISLKRDLLDQLTGEVTVDLDDLTPTKPAWKLILGVNDSAHLQQTLSTLLTAAHMIPEAYKGNDLTYYRVRFPSAKAPSEIDYAFAGGYLIVGPSYGAVAAANASHIAGNSLAKSANFLASLPPGHPSGASALFYEDPAAMATLQLKQAAPEMARSFAQFTSASKPQVACLYADATAIRGTSTSAGVDASALLIGAAIAIPNLLRSRMAANEASAVATLRTAVTAEVTFSSAHPDRGFAPDLATLGTKAAGTSAYTPGHSGLIDASLGNPGCTSGAWCTKSGFRFSLAAGCKGKLCTDFVIVGTPISANTGGRSFCSTSDGVIRFKPGSPLLSPVTVSECRAWSPVQ